MTNTYLEIGKWRLTGWPATVGCIAILIFLNLPAFLLGYLIGSAP